MVAEDREPDPAPLYFANVLWALCETRKPYTCTRCMQTYPKGPAYRPLRERAKSGVRRNHRLCICCTKQRFP